MITRIKNYWKLRKLRRDAIAVAGEMEAPLLIINGADIAEEVKNLIEFIHVFLENPSEIGKRLSSENMDAIMKFMEEISNTNSYNEKKNEKMSDSSQKLRKEETSV